MSQSRTRVAPPRSSGIAVARTVPFALIHVAAVAGVAVVGATPELVAIAAASYVVRLWGVLGGYHRYFAHRGYQTNRWFQFVIALVGCTAGQRGPLWWAAHHRTHHRYSDTERDPHSPMNGFWWAHVGWIIAKEHEDVALSSIEDFAKWPELRWLDKYYYVPPAVFFLATYLLFGLPVFVWACLVATVAGYHLLFCANSVCHIFGTRRYRTHDTSRNNWVMAILLLGEGWHNNHHYFPACARQGFFWWEIDPIYYSLRALRTVGLVWGLREPPRRALHVEHGAGG